MNYKIEQKLDEWSYKVEQENLITWSNVLNDPKRIHLDNKTVKKLGYEIFVDPTIIVGHEKTIVYGKSWELYYN